MHKAEVTERRVVNSAMLVVVEADEISPGEQRDFVTADTISQEVY
jgi:hypothetical protein